MKTKVVMMSIIIVLFAASIHAQELLKKHPLNEVQIGQAKKNILMGLRSGNKGVIEASLILIAKIKMVFPHTNIVEIRTVIDSLAYTSSSDTLRYKAYLTSNICIDPEWFSTEGTLQQTGIDVFFISVSQRLQNKLLGINSF